MKDAIALLEANWRGTPVVQLTTTEVWRALRRAQRRRVIGGQTYDMLIAACALKAGARTIITWNVHHLATAAREIDIEVPG
ncbi:MAG: PIN domain-containing protein [Gemmatimonadetes bacterium]|nr:PIN domain-containing protein [Gemmatimonadota bacterium]MYG22538.1 PIN domain-containing protein [Gemmatimonadota bacterium]MYJ38929.1 PIN domain-containing protein [Gemmatimonadota bacterium]